MDFPTKIRCAEKQAKISEAELARRFGISRIAFINRKRLGRYSAGELDRMAELMGAKFEYNFVFPDGKKI